MVTIEIFANEYKRCCAEEERLRKARAQAEIDLSRIAREYGEATQARREAEGALCDAARNMGSPWAYMTGAGR